MKVIYLNIIVEEAGKRELNMILDKDEMENEEIDTEIKKYLDRMFAKDEIDGKFKKIVDYLAKRIADDEPTINSIFKAHRDS